jgi:hypothetical protein
MTEIKRDCMTEIKRDCMTEIRKDCKKRKDWMTVK